MTTQEQIEKDLGHEYTKFINEKYVGKLAVPGDLIELFKIAVNTIPPSHHNMSFFKIKNIISAKRENLTVSEIGDILPMVLNVSPEKLYSDFNKMIERIGDLKNFQISFNLFLNEFNEKLKMRRANLMSLTSIKNRGGGSMSIVN